MASSLSNFMLDFSRSSSRADSCQPSNILCFNIFIKFLGIVAINKEKTIFSEMVKTVNIYIREKLS